MTGMVDRFEGHAAGHGPIPDHGNAFEVFTAVVPRQSHPECGGNGGAGMTRAEMIETTLRPLEIAGHSVLLTQGSEVVVPTGDQLVGISLVADIPDHTVVIEIEGLIQSKCELHDAQPRAEMTTAGGHHLEVALANLTSNIFQLSDAESMQLIRMLQISEMHAQLTAIHAIYGVRPFNQRLRALERMV